MSNSTTRPFASLDLAWLVNIYEDLKNFRDRESVAMFNEAVAELSLRGFFTTEATLEVIED